MGDEIKFLSSDERALAMDLGQSMIAEQGAIDDEDRVGREVASQVAQRVKNLRSHYEQRTMDALRKRGVLQDTPGQPNPGPGEVQPRSEFDQGAQMARERFGVQQNQQS